MTKSPAFEKFNAKLNQVFSQYHWLFPIMTIGFLGWITNSAYITIPILALYTLCIFIFCDEINNILPIIFAVPFFIKELTNTSHFIIFGISIAVFLLGSLYFVIKKIRQKAKIKKGKLFYPFIFLIVGCFLGGLGSYFDIVTSLLVSLCFLVAYYIYWLAINFSHNLKEYICYTFIAIGCTLFTQLLISYFQGEEIFLINITYKSVIFIGLQHINTVAVYFLIALICSFQLGYKNKHDYLYALLALFFVICTYFTYARMATLLCGIFLIVCLIIMFIKSEHKPIFIISGIFLIITAIVLFTAYYDEIIKIFSWHINLGVSGNGRDELWPWCVEKFLHSKAFGVGFVSDDPVPTLVTTDKIILAHNTVLQYLTSCGIVGTILVSYFYVEKYIICIKHFNEFKLFNLLQIIMIALIGIVDQCPTMDLFIIIINLIFIALAEIDTSEQVPIQNTTEKQEKNTRKWKRSK